MIDESVKAKIYELEEAAAKDYNDSPYLDEYLEGYRDGLHQAAKELSTAPTVDAVPVVQCGECRWWSKDEPDDEYGYCYNGKIIGSTKENWYCADGKRKDGDTDGE